MYAVLPLKSGIPISTSPPNGRLLYSVTNFCAIIYETLLAVHMVTSKMYCSVPRHCAAFDDLLLASSVPCSQYSSVAALIGEHLLVNTLSCTTSQRVV